MDHFKQGLKGPIKRMIAGHIFTSFQEMYQRAVKIARVIEETEAKSQQMSLAKRRFSQEDPALKRIRGLANSILMRTEARESKLCRGKK